MHWWVLYNVHGSTNASRRVCLICFWLLLVSQLFSTTSGGWLWPWTAAVSPSLHSVSLWRPVRDRNIHTTRHSRQQMSKYEKACHLPRCNQDIYNNRAWVCRVNIEVRCRIGCFELSVWIINCYYSFFFIGFWLHCWFLLWILFVVVTIKSKLSKVS